MGKPTIIKKDKTIVQNYFVYILRCADDTLYTGITNDVPRRLLEHQTGKGGKYTRVHKGVEMVFVDTCKSKGDALRREIAIKKLSRSTKLALIQSAI